MVGLLKRYQLLEDRRGAEQLLGMTATQQLSRLVANTSYIRISDFWEA